MFRYRAVNIDLLRFLAALFVTFGHARAMIFEDFDRSEKLDLLKIGFYWVTSLGHASVIFFFVLSGYLVGGGILKSVLESRFDLLKFLINRMTRIWIVLLPGLIFVYFLNRVSCQYLVYTTFCQGELPHNLSAGPVDLLDNSVLFWKTIFFLVSSDMGNGYYGGNQLLWSLKYEIGAYLFCIVLGSIFTLFTKSHINIKSRKNLILLQQVILTTLLIYWLYCMILGGEFIIFLLLFVSGAISFKLSSNRLHSNRFRIGTGTFVIVLITLGQLTRQFPVQNLIQIRISFSDFLLGLIFAFLLSYAHIPKESEHRRNNRFRSIDFSFSLYITHLPIQGLIDGINYGNNLFVFCQMIFASLIVAKIFAYFTENRTNLLRKRILNLLESK